jgi:hypothetical protein
LTYISSSGTELLSDDRDDMLLPKQLIFLFRRGNGDNKLSSSNLVFETFALVALLGLTLLYQYTGRLCKAHAAWAIAASLPGLHEVKGEQYPATLRRKIGRLMIELIICLS